MHSVPLWKVNSTTKQQYKRRGHMLQITYNSTTLIKLSEYVLADQFVC